MLIKAFQPCAVARAATVAVKPRAATVAVKPRAATVAVAVAVAVAVDSAFDVSPREGAARRQHLKRIKKRRLSERSEFRRFPFQVLATRAVRAKRGPLP